MEFDFKIWLLADYTSGGHGGNKADDCRPRITHKRFCLGPEVVDQKSSNCNLHNSEQRSQLEKVLALGEKREETEGDNGVSAE